MIPSDEDPPDRLLTQEELVTLEAQLRAAIQHRDAAVERQREAQAQVEALLARARALLRRGQPQG